MTTNSKPEHPLQALQILKNPVHFLAFGFGAGLAPKAPGTAGTLVAVPLYVALVSFLDFYLYLGVVIVAFAVGIYLCAKTASDLGVHDHGGIVWDEFVGFWVTMILVPLTWYWLVAGFLFFRVFDIVKPFPIGWLDRKVHGGLGIMLDDLIAGIYAGIVLHLLVFYTGF